MKQHIFLFLILLFSSNISAIVIHKCIQENGTTSYQKDSCVADERTILEKIKDKNKVKQNIDLTDKEIAKYMKENIDSFSIDLKSYNIYMLKSKHWKVFKKILGDNIFHLKLVDDKKGSEISLLIDFIHTKDNQSFTQEELNKLLIQSTEKQLSASVQEKINPIIVEIENGIGVITNFTDKILDGKSSYPAGEYLNTTKGLIFKDNFIIHFTLLNNKYNSLNYAMAISSMLKGIEITKLKTSNELKTVDDPLDKPYENYHKGNKRESVAMFEEVISNDPNNFKAWIGYCLTLRDINRLQSAFIACDKALYLSPNNIDVFATLINLYSKARIWSEGNQFIENHVPSSDNENLINAITNFGFYAMKDNKLDVAQKAFENVKKRGSNEIRLNVDLAMLKYMQGKKQNALKDIKTVLRTNPVNSYARSAQELIKSNQPFNIANQQEEPYTKVPKRLRVLGDNENHNQLPDKWVQKIFPLKGIGSIEVNVPENWYEMTEIGATDNNTNEIAIKLFNSSLDKLLMTLNIGKVSTDWNMDDLRKLMLSNISLFFDIEENQIKSLNTNTLHYKKQGTKKDGIAFNMQFIYSMNKNIVTKILVIDSTNNSSDTIERIINSLEIKSPNYLPLNTPNKHIEEMPESDLPQAPKGFKWVRMPEIMAAFLKPNGWYEHNRKSKDAHTFALSKESVKENGSFETGLTIIAIKNIMDKYNLPPYAVSLEMFEDIKTKPSNKILQSKDVSQGPFKSFIVQYENNPEVAIPIIVHKIFISNDKTGSLYIVSFESPKSEWDSAWKIGEIILKNYLIDDEF